MPNFGEDKSNVNKAEKINEEPSNNVTVNSTSSSLFFYNNKKSFETGATLDQIPKDKLFISSDNYFFNADELANHFKYRGIFENPYTDSPFDAGDLTKLLQFKTINEIYVEQSDRCNSARENVNAISQETLDKIHGTADQLSKGILPLDVKIGIIIEFSEYFFEKITQQERDIINLLPNMNKIYCLYSVKNLNDYFHKLSDGDEKCLNGIAGFLRELYSHIIDIKEQKSTKDQPH